MDPQFYLAPGLPLSTQARLAAAAAALAHFRGGTAPPIFPPAVQAVIDHGRVWLLCYVQPQAGQVPEEAAGLQAFVDFLTDPLAPPTGPYWMARLSDYAEVHGETYALAYSDAYTDLARHYAADAADGPGPAATQIWAWGE